MSGVGSLSAPEFVTSRIEQKALLLHIDKIVGILLGMGFRKVDAEYGWGCNLPEDARWKRHPVSLDSLNEFVMGAAAAGVFRPGSSDLFIVDSEAQFHILICHESDIHLRATDPDLVGRFLELWKSEGIEVNTLAEDGEWKAV